MVRASRPRVLPLVTALIGVAVSVSARAAPLEFRAADRTRALVQAISQMKGDDNERALAVVDDYLDFDGITRAALAPRADRMSEADRADLLARVRRLLRRAGTVEGGRFLRRARLSYGTARVEADTVVVPIHARVPDEDAETKIDLRWKDVGGALRVVDVAFDGDSLVKEYQGRIARIYDREGVPGLVKKLSEREAALDQASAKK